MAELDFVWRPLNFVFHFGPDRMRVEAFAQQEGGPGEMAVGEPGGSSARRATATSMMALCSSAAPSADLRGAV
jgi:hypothetical protein